MKETVQYIWSDLHGELRNFIRSWIGDPVQAEDLLQEIFIKIHLHLHQLKDPERLTAWVYQISRNVISDHFRQLRTAGSHTLSTLPDREEEEPLYASLSSCINGKIARLSSKGREAILLTYFQNYSQKDLAGLLGLSYSGTKNRIQRAREKLRRDILDCERVVADPSGRITEVVKK